MKLSLYARKMLLYIIICTVIFIIGAVILCVAVEALSNYGDTAALTTADILPAILGILLSAIIGVIKTLLLENQVSKLSIMDDPNKAKLYASGQAVFRFLLTGGGLIAAHFIPFTHLYAAFAGAFIWNIAAYALKFVKIDEEV